MRSWNFLGEQQTLRQEFKNASTLILHHCFALPKLEDDDCNVWLRRWLHSIWKIPIRAEQAVALQTFLKMDIVTVSGSPSCRKSGGQGKAAGQSVLCQAPVRAKVRSLAYALRFSQWLVNLVIHSPTVPQSHWFIHTVQTVQIMRKTRTKII